MIDYDAELLEQLAKSRAEYKLDENVPSREFAMEYNRIIGLYQCKKRMQKEGITDESLIFNIGEVIGSEVYGTVNAKPSYSYDKITASEIEIYNNGKRFKVSADGYKIKIEKIL